MKRLVVVVMSLVFLSGCLSSEDAPIANLVFQEYFIEGTEGWIAEYSEYEEGLEDSLKFNFKHGFFYTDEVIGNVSAAIQTGYGTDSVLFMYIKRQIGGLAPNKQYKALVATELYSQFVEKYEGLDIADPDKGSFLKFGLFTSEPHVKTVVDGDDPEKSIVITDFDKGAPDSNGKNLILIGKIKQTNIGADPIVITADSSDRSITVTSDSDGKVWILVGIDSNLPIYQTIYYTVIYAQFE